MALWGQGDPRWLVEERSDATNVNNWHWTEKNASPWSQQRLRQLLEGLEIEAGSVLCKLDKITKMEGEASANNRKAKLIFLFEWELKVTFVGRISGSDLEYKGYIEIPNLSDENEAGEVDVNVTVETRGTGEQQIRHILATHGQRIVRDKIGEYIRELKEEFSKGLILPTNNVKPQVVTKERTVDKKTFQNQVIASASASATAASTGPLETTDIELNDRYKVEKERLWEVLEQKELVARWSNNGCQEWDFREGGRFALFGGNVSGTFVKVDAPNKIVMNWRLRSFPGDHHALVTFSLNDKGDATDLLVRGERVPKPDADKTSEGLRRYYLQSIGRTFGFSVQVV